MAHTQSNIEAQAETVLDILAAQCRDLEVLLALARRETEAAERRDFDEVLRIVGERATLGERLEIYQRRIADFRAQCGEGEMTTLAGNPLAPRLAALAANIEAQDARTRPLLVKARDDASQKLAKLNSSQSRVNAYLRESRAVCPTAYDKRA